MEEVQLQSKDGVVIQISRRALRRSEMLSSIAESELGTEIIRLPSVTTLALEKIADFLNVIENIAANETDMSAGGQRFNQIEQPEMNDDDESITGESSADSSSPMVMLNYIRYSRSLRYSKVLEAYNERFLQSMSFPTLIEVIMTADYLQIDSILLLCSRELINLIEGRTEEKRRLRSSIGSDLISLIENREELLGSRSIRQFRARLHD